MHLHIAEFNSPIPPEVALRYPNPERAKSHCASRLALQQCLLDEGHRPAPQQLELSPQDPTHLPGFPNVRVSLSHTKGLGGALLAKRHEFLGVGLDLEWEDRPIQVGGDKFFVNPMDQLPPSITLWCLKEAAFKALFSEQSSFQKLYGRELLLKDIWVQGQDFGLVVTKGRVLGRVQRESRPLNGRSLLVAQAFFQAQISLPTDTALE